MIELKSASEIEKIHDAGRILNEALEKIKEAVVVGMTTLELDRIAEETVIAKGGELLFKGYQGFPANICASINEEVVHGIPSKRQLKNGDIISIDIGVRYRNYCADAAVTMAVGSITKEAKKLIKVCSNALDRVIGILRPGMLLSEVAGCIQEFVESNGFSVVRDFVGHGIGREMHEDPQVPNFVSRELLDNDIVLASGTVIAIEPMVNVGTSDVEIMKNGWTVVTKDRSLSAHFEHTIAITDKGSVILTRA